jgi:hypothetical protein
VERALFGEIPFRGTSPVSISPSWTMMEGLSPEYISNEMQVVEEAEAVHP